MLIYRRMWVLYVPNFLCSYVRTFFVIILLKVIFQKKCRFITETFRFNIRYLFLTEPNVIYVNFMIKKEEEFTRDTKLRCPATLLYLAYFLGYR